MLHKTIILFALMLSACATGSDDPTELESDTTRGPLGKADGFGSCVDTDCDSKSDGSCWCDELCTFFGDCCSDRVEVCEAPVSQFCGGLLGYGCADNEYCHFDNEAICGSADASGTCRPRPDSCSAQIAPVCGCNGQTYSNSCQAAALGTTVLHEGACKNE